MARVFQSLGGVTVQRFAVEEHIRETCKFEAASRGFQDLRCGLDNRMYLDVQ